MVNSMNFIDGLDGLSSGIGFIAALTLGIISLTTAIGPLGQPFVAVLCFALAGSLAGFLRWNFFPATVFAGTSGVMFVGYTLAILSILGTAKVAVAILVLGVPIIDTFWILIRRMGARRSPFKPDRGHIHHRLLDLGLSHLQTVHPHLRDLHRPWRDGAVPARDRPARRVRRADPRDRARVLRPHPTVGRPVEPDGPSQRRQARGFRSARVAVMRPELGPALPLPAGKPAPTPNLPSSKPDALATRDPALSPPGRR